MKTFYTIKDGKIDRIQTGDSPAGKAEWQEAPNDWKGSHGDKLEWFDSAMRRIPDAELIKQGKRKDNIGKVYNINDKTSRIIYCLDEELGENETKEAPLENESYQKFDRQLNQWVVETEKKERAEKEAALSKAKAEIAEYEQKRLRSILASLDGEADEEDEEYNLNYKTLIEKQRIEIKRIEAELKSA
jgi:hypothetical protein